MTDAELTSFFDKLLNRAPTDGEKRVLLQLQKQLGINDDDGLWLVLVALSHYQKLYEEIPERIEVAGANAAELAKKRLGDETAAERARIRGELTEAVTEAVNDAARARAGTVWRNAIVISAMAFLFHAFFVGYVAYEMGYNRGHQVSNEEQVWAASDNAKYARTLSDAGLLGMLAACRANDGALVIRYEGHILCETDGSWPQVGFVSERALSSD